MNRCYTFFLTLILAISIFSGACAEWDVKSDTWVATDALGRQLPGYEECGPPRAGKHIGMFYFLWLGQHGTGGPYDITKILAENPSNPQYGPVNAFHHWGESELGYYLSQEPYVIRKHCEMLLDAGVDTLVFDVTNNFPYTSNYMQLCGIYQQIRNDGGRTPQICFLVNPTNNSLVQTLYNDLYSKNLYSGLWFRWLGKPLILTRPDGLNSTLQSFFTFRETWAWSNSWWFNGKADRDKWTWLDHYPQGYGYHTPVYPEETSVCAAQHATSNIGRSFHNGGQPAPANYRTDEGLCFAEQWRGALEIDPEFIFVTNWNEWVAQRFQSSGSDTFLGKQLAAGESYFVDEYNQEYSRDIEPMKGGHTDNYYYQTIANIRRYKGVTPPEVPGASQSISIDGGFTDWQDVGPEYRDYIGDKVYRSYPGWGSAGRYLNLTGRNDFVKLKVARDMDNIYFYAETKGPISTYSGSNWMLLFIDSDCDISTGWHGYDYLVNSTVKNSTTTTVKRSYGGWNWNHVADVPYKVSGNKLELKIPRTALGKLQGDDLTLDFHWADNILKTDDITEFAINGDSAPNRRFNYRYSTRLIGVAKLTAKPSDGANSLSWINPSDPRYIKTVIRYKTGAFPVSPTDGFALCEIAGTSGNASAFTHTGLSNGATYYYSAFAFDAGGAYSKASTVCATPARTICFTEEFNYADGNLSGMGGWNGSAASEIEVVNETLKINGGTGSFDVSHSVSCVNGPVWVRVKIKAGTGLSNLWNLYVDDQAGKNLACWYGTGTTVRGRIAGSSILTGIHNLTGGWDDLLIKINTNSNISEFFINGLSIGQIDHGAVGAGDAVGRVRFERYSNADAVGHYVYFDDLAVEPIDVTLPVANISGPSVKLTRTGPVTYTVNFSEPVLGFDSSEDIMVGLTGSATAGKIGVTGCEAGPYTVTLSGITGSGIINIRVRGATCWDRQGNVNYWSAASPAFSVITNNGSIAEAKRNSDGTPVALGAKALYLKSGDYGYIEEAGRFSGIRVEGNIDADEGELVRLSGTLQTREGQEKYILLDSLYPDGAGIVKPVGASNKTLALGGVAGLYVTAWGTVKPGSVTDNSFVITDGSDYQGVKVITSGTPGVVENTFVIVSGAVGYSGGMVIYKQ